jgi:multimeric flavodoxin WrbA
MKVLAVNGSARKGGNTLHMLEAAAGPLADAGVQVEIVELGAKRIQGCTACSQCYKKQDGFCYGRKDFGNEVIEKMAEADGMLLGSPVYFADVTAEMKALIDRAGYVARANDDIHARKVGAAVAAVRRAGAIHTLDTINHFFQIGQMYIVSSHYWNLGVGRKPGEVLEDEEGMDTMRILGENMAWLMERIHAK